MMWIGILLIFAGLWNLGWVFLVFEHPLQQAMCGIVGTFSILGGIFMIIANKTDDEDDENDERS
jgi:uncharacterized membrane protein HdeD (DUF308 family)